MLSLTKTRFIHALRRIIILAVLYLLQTNVFTHFEIFGAIPMLLPGGVIGISLFSDNHWGAMWGVAAGVLCSVSIGGSPLVFPIALGAVGLMTGYLTECYFAATFVTYVLLTALTLIALTAIQVIPLYAFTEVELNLLLPVAVAQLVYSFVLALPLYAVCARLRDR